MLGTAAVVVRGQASAASTYTGRVTGYSPDWYLPLAESVGTTATALIGPNGTYQNNPQLGVDSIAQDDPGGRSVGLSAATTDTPHITATSPLAGPNLTIDLIVQLDDLTKAKHVLINSASLNDGFSLEVLTNGQVRAFSRQGATAFPIVGTVGDVPQGEAVKITYQRQSNVAGWSQRVYVNGVLKAEDTVQRTWASVAPGTVYIGAFGASLGEPTDGLIAHLAGWNRLLTLTQIQDLVRPQSIAWAENIDAGSVDTNTSKVISVRQGGWHGKTPLTATAGNGSFVTTTESGENITIIAGGSSGSDDDFFYSFTDATSKTSSTKTVTIDVTGASVAFTVPLAPAAPSATTIYVSSGIGPGAATAGSDTTGNGTIGNPYKTLAKALSVAASGNQVILRKGIYRNEANLNVSVTNLTIKGYATDISAGPLNPNNWPIIDGSIDMSSVTWELVHSGRQEYRTTQTNLVSGTQIGCAILPGTSPYQIPRWEPLQGWREPRKMTRLPAYGNEGTTGPWSWTDSFRHTGTVVADQTEYYLGPGVARASDNRIHIRLQPIDPSVLGGVVMDPYGPNYNPANHTVFLWSEDRTLFSAIANGLTVEGVFIRGYDDIRRDITQSNVTFRRNVIWAGHFQSALLNTSGANNFTIQHNVYVGGLSDWHVWGAGKHTPFGTIFGLNMGRIALWSHSGVGANMKILDNLMLRCFDVVAANTNPPFDIEIAYNAIEVIDDLTQLNNLNHEHIHHNFVVGPLMGSGGDTPLAGNRHHIHHNICVLTRWRCWRETKMWSWTIYTPHSPQHGRNYRIYHNTFVFTNPRRESTSANTSNMPPSDQGLRFPQSPEFQNIMNNICVIVNRDPPGPNAAGPMSWMGGFSVNDAASRGRMDGNAYHRVFFDGLSGGFRFGSVTHSGGNSANFANLAAFKSSTHFNESKDLYAPGWENSGIEANPQFQGGSAMFTHEGREAAPADYIPQNPAYHTGAINLGSGGLNLGVPGYTYRRGAARSTRREMERK